MYRLARYPRLKEIYSTVFPSAVTAEASAQLNTPWESEDDAQSTIVFERDDDAPVYCDEAPTSIARYDVQEKPEVWEAVGETDCQS